MSEPALLDPPTTTGPAPAVSLTDLILLRLLPTKASIQLKQLHTDLGVFFRRPMSAEHLEDALTELRADGFVAPKGQRATDAGRARALEYLGIEKLPPRANWPMVKGKYLVPRALGLALGSEKTTKSISDSKSLAPLLLKRELRLPVGTGTTLNAVFEAIACRQLGYLDHTTLKELRPLLLAKAVGSETPVSAEEAETVVPRILLSTKQNGIAGLQAIALAGWADTATPELVPELFDLEMFANTVKSAARRCPTGQFGDGKVFISHVWNQLRNESQFAPLGIDGFKQKLVEANQSRLLNLLPADLNQAFDPADLTDSHTTQRNSTYHLIATGDAQ